MAVPTLLSAYYLEYSLVIVVDVENKGVWRVQQHKSVGRKLVHKRGTIGVDTLLA